MLILAFDSSTAAVAVAVARVGSDGVRELLAEVSVPSRGPSEVLLPAVDAVLGLVGCGVGEVERILVGVGPGTFTGIRISASVARSLSLSTGAALSTVSTLDALASPALSVSPSVLAVLDARRRQVFARRFDAGGPAGEVVCVYPDDLRDAMAPGSETGSETLVVGDGAVRYREALSDLGRIPPDASPLHRVSGRGLVLAADLSPVPAERVVPIYVREPDAEARKDLNPWSRP